MSEIEIIAAHFNPFHDPPGKPEALSQRQPADLPEPVVADAV